MNSRSRRVAAFALGPASAAALGVVVIASVSLASGNGPAATRFANTAAGPGRGAIVTPLGHPKPSGQKPFAGAAGTQSPWTSLSNPPPFGTPGTMLLQSDGTVLVHNEPDNNVTGGTTQWWKLTPDAAGNYADGTWSQVASMPAGYTPLYFGSAILPDGRMIVEGGEYIGEKAVWSNKGAIYDPVTNSWTAVAPPPGWTSIGDAATDVLPNGTLMLQHPCNGCSTSNGQIPVDDALLHAGNLTWTVIPATGKTDPNDEEGWTLEPSGQLLTVDTWGIGNTELFNPSSNTWSFAGATPAGSSPVDPYPVVEIGPQVELPSGNTFVVGGGTSTFTSCTGASTATAVYHYSAGHMGTWTAGPQIPPIGGLEYGATDGPGATLPDGDVLFDASACVYDAPTHFFLYHPASGALTQIPDAPNAVNDTSYVTRMLELPNGQILYNDGTSQMEVYTAGGTPQSGWKPSVSSLSASVLSPGATYTATGTQLAGRDPGATYGDDVQDNTNFPLVRITNSATGVVTYARTHDWTSVSIAAGAPSSTKFTLPASTPAGKSTLVVIANGIASAPKTVTIS